ncbi:non-heme iron oxygenase ferredoxin subunit [Candidatus Woesearchaeota archaeon]|nr:non-heme iron oxygenase ferredoxin subunit [Candidatus Woesearchaeota archaeon]
MPFIIACKTSDIKPGSMQSFTLNNKNIAIANVDGNFFAFSNECTHVQAPLAEGSLEGTTVTCPWHGAQFDVTTGKVLAAPAQDNIGCFRLKIENSEILVDA